MDGDISVEEFNKIFDEKSSTHENTLVEYGSSLDISKLSDSSFKKSGVKLMLQNLIWFNSCDSVPDSLERFFKGKVCSLDSWYDTTVASISINTLPIEVTQHLEKFSGRLGYSQIT
jgi:hypothetical protein